MQVVIQRAVGQTHDERRGDPPTGEWVTQRLAAEFPALRREEIERCVTETWICARHLGLAVSPYQIERIAREHLLGVVNSVPPSGRPPLPRSPV